MQLGRVRLEDQLEKAEADTVDDEGRRHQFLLPGVKCSRCVFIGTIVPLLHRFLIGVARVTVNQDGRGGTALIPWYGIKVVGKRFAGLIFGSMLILSLSPALLVS